MPIGDAPTRERGTASGPYAQNPWTTDPVENVPDLLFPDSVTTYARMRRDPTVKSVLNAYTLPILRAPWHVDPRGASDAAARVVADSLGLPVLGDDPVDGPINTRWVRWTDHLRMALRDLVYGFLPFEPVYDVTSGTAYLAGLPERMPWSITEVTSDTAGRLTGIRQARTGLSDVTIPAGLLLYYVHEREGNNWYGTSLLREAFAPWLFKVDALRGQSRTLRRFGTGVPVMEPLPGTNPTAAQITEAQRLAAAFRGDSDTSAATTPGFRLRVVGVEGAVPDHLPWLRYLDEQIARSALTSVLDLGSTSNGSRALGKVFLDLLVQAMQAVAEEHASTASVLARRLTDFNEGAAAEAPIIVVGDVGSSRQTLAQTVAGLVTAGALVADTALEAWVRDAFDLPPSTGTPAAPPPPAAPTPPPALPAAGDLALTAAQGAPFRSGQATQDGWPYRRPLTDVEAAAGLDPLTLDAVTSGIVDGYLTGWPLLVAPQQTALVDAVTAAAGDYAALAGFVPPYDDAATSLADAMRAGYAAGADSARREATAQGVPVPPPGPEPAGWVDATARAAAASLAAGLAAGTIREAVRVTGPATTPEEAAAGVDTYLASLTGAPVRDVAAGVVNAAVNAGRHAVMRAATGAAGPVRAAATGDPLLDTLTARYYASEVRDAGTCGPCLEVDGTEYGSLEEAEAAYPTGGYVDCDGRLRCRGVIYASYEEN